MNLIERLTGLITNPDKTMEDVAKEPRIEEALVVVAIYAILGAVLAYISASKVHTEYINSTVDMSSYGAISGIFAVIGGLIMPFIMWIIITVVLYLFAMVFGGEGKFTHVLTALGLSNLVKILPVIIAILLLTQAPSYTLQVDMNNPLSSINSPEAKNYSMNIFVLLSQIVVLLGIVWSSIIGMFGIKHTEKVSMTSAGLIVGIPLAIYVIFQLLSFATALL